jgi:hypothetical protein
MLATADEEVVVGVDDVLLRRIRAEFRGMPGLRLTPAQARRLWGLDAPVCDALLALLIHEGFLRWTGDGSFVRADMV